MTDSRPDRYVVCPSKKEPSLWCLYSLDTGQEVFTASYKVVMAERAQRKQYDAVEHRGRKKAT